MRKYEKILVLVTLAGLAGFVYDFGILLPRCREQTMIFRVTRGSLTLHGSPSEGSGAPATLYRGCEFVVTRKRSGRWVYALVRSAGGWTTREDLAEHAEQVSGPPLDCPAREPVARYATPGTGICSPWAARTSP